MSNICGNCIHFQLVRKRTVYSPQTYRCGKHGYPFNTPAISWVCGDYKTKKQKMEGYATGEQCNRDGCTGIITEHDKDGCCSCHINPPCDYCASATGYCPVCGWDDVEEQRAAPVYELSDKDKATYKAERDSRYEFIENFNRIWRGEKEADQLILIPESHTHFSMKVRGVHPAGYVFTDDDLRKIRGTFGGRYEYKDDRRFIYIAYTD